jgi:hypothetical protein
MNRIPSILFGLLLAAASCSNPAPDSSPPPARNASPPAVELEEAISLSNAFLPTLNRNPSDLKLVKVENLVFRGPDGPAIWRITYKERNALGALGGELYVEVDLNQKKAKFLGTGE